MAGVPLSLYLANHFGWRFPFVFIAVISCGFLLWLRFDGAQLGLLLRRRPEKGLLGGMLGLPGDAWDGQGGPAPAEADWQDIGEINDVLLSRDGKVEALVKGAMGDRDQDALGFQRRLQPVARPRRGGR